MSDSTNTAGSFLQALAWLLFALAGLAFWIGGRAISEFAKVDRMLAEIEGIGLTVIFGALGAVAKSFAERIDEDVEEPKPMYDPDLGKK